MNKASLKIGDLTERITLMKRNVKEDEQGDLSEKWEKTENLWAKISPICVTEKLGQEGWNEEKKIKLRYRITIRACSYLFHRIKWAGDFYSVITPPQLDEKKRWLTFVIEQKDGGKE